MARPLRISYPGAYYHVFCRGNNRQDVFLSNKDRFHFLRVLAKTVTRFDWACYAYCLMNNHFHLLIKTLQPNISDGMKFLNGTFTQYFNWTHGRVGHLFQGRFKSPVVQEKLYFRRLCRYIVMNPVEAGIIAHPGEYGWSSFNATMGRAPMPDFLSASPVLDQWGSSLDESRKAYEQYVLESPGDSPLDEMKSQLYLGDNQFLQELQPHLTERLFKRLLMENTISLHEPLAEILMRPDGLLIAKRQLYSHRDIAEYLGISIKTVSRRMKALEDVRGVRLTPAVDRA